VRVHVDERAGHKATPGVLDNARAGRSACGPGCRDAVDIALGHKDIDVFFVSTVGVCDGDVGQDERFANCRQNRIAWRQGMHPGVASKAPEGGVVPQRRGGLAAYHGQVWCRTTATVYEAHYGAFELVKGAIRPRAAG
jgi:hypothetical protein